MPERFEKVERQVTKLLGDLDRLRRENVTLRAENAKITRDLQDRLNRLDAVETATARYTRVQEEHTRYKQERAQIRREARSLLRRVRGIKKGGGA